MFAADQAPAISVPTSSDQDVIEVIGRRSDQALKIDRRTYQVQQTPHAQQKDAIQLLRGLPAVTISPEDEINLLGSSDVKIFVNGRPYQGDATQYLRTLHGTDIERIEIITNPSAQYSAQGTAGIINFVLRKKQSEGTSGNAIAEVTNRGLFAPSATLKYKNGEWTYELVATARAGTNSRSTYHKLRRVESTDGGAPTINTEDGRGVGHLSEGDLAAKATYQLDVRTSISAEIRGAFSHSLNAVDAEFLGITPNFQSFSDHRRQTDVSPFFGGELTLDHKGRKEGESLAGSLRLYDAPFERGRTTESYSNGGALSVLQTNRFQFGGGQIDWQHPVDKGQILSVGGSWDYQHQVQHYSAAFSGSGGSSLEPNSTDEFSATTNTLAAYATFQQPIGTWTVMPGLRAEQNIRHVASAGVPDVSVHRTNLFPTLHIEHPISKALDLTLSYSKRIDRAGPDMLRPYRVIQDVLTSGVGNPRLKDQSTDAYEINLHYHRRKVDAGLIVYDRETSQLWGTEYTVVDGANLYRWINAGHRSNRGAELDISAPLIRHVKANASFNLFDQHTPIFLPAGTATEHAFRYTTDATLEWDAPERGNVPGDVAQLEVKHYSRFQSFEIVDAPRNEFRLSFTHSFASTWSVTALLDHWTGISHRLSAPLVQEYYSERMPVEFRVRLLKTFGNP